MSGTRLVGIVILIFGVGILLEQLDMFHFTNVLANWWPVFFIVIGIIQLWTGGVSTLLPAMIMFGVGILLLVNIWIDYNIWLFIWPFVLIMVGLSLIFTKRTFQREDSDADEVHVKTFFSGAELRNESDNFGGGTIVAVFGGSKIDLRQAVFTEDKAVLDITTVFGGVELFLPEDVRVEISGMPIFGGWEDKTSPHPKDGARKTLYINGVALFGGIELHN